MTLATSFPGRLYTDVGCRSQDHTSTTYMSLQFLAFFWSDVFYILLLHFRLHRSDI